MEKRQRTTRQANIYCFRHFGYCRCYDYYLEKEMEQEYWKQEESKRVVTVLEFQQEVSILL